MFLSVGLRYVLKIIIILVYSVGQLLYGITYRSSIPNDATNNSVESGPRFEYVEDPDGQLDLWKPGDLDSAKYNPDIQHVYHLFTRKNPTVSQALKLGEEDVLRISNFNPENRTVLLLHGWIANVTAECNTVLVSAFLAAGDVNVIAVDWSSGADTTFYLTALTNTRTGGKSIARYISWLHLKTGVALNKFHLVGYSLGAHLAGVIGRNLGGKIGYITGLDPALLGFIFNSDRLRPSDALYTEIIHTNAGLLGYPSPLGHTDFYPNGGMNMPGSTNSMSDHARSYFYFAESLISGGFTAKPCASYIKAMRGKCKKEGDNLKMGGLIPKTGCTGIYHLKTNLVPPFSKG